MIPSKLIKRCGSYEERRMEMLYVERRRCEEEVEKGRGWKETLGCLSTLIFRGREEPVRRGERWIRCVGSP